MENEARVIDWVVSIVMMVAIISVGIYLYVNAEKIVGNTLYTVFCSFYDKILN